jgi:transketolase
MREEFVRTAVELLDERADVVIVLADISVSLFGQMPSRHRDRIINVGIREQALVGVAGGLALAGMRPIVHTFAPFMVERAFEQVKLDLTHQDVPAVLVSIGASYDEAAYGRTHQAPEDVAVMSTLPGWRIDVPSASADVAALLRHAVSSGGRTYLRLTERPCDSSGPTNGRLRIVRRGRRAVVLAMGPLIDRVQAATAMLDVTVLHATTVLPLDTATLVREAGLLAGSPTIVTVQPYLAGTSAAQISDAFSAIAHRLLNYGVREVDLHRFGTAEDHDRAHGLDEDSLRERITAQVEAQLDLHPPGATTL